MLNRLAAAFATAGLALTLALPARADRVAEMSQEPSSVPIAFDIAVMRPLGLLMCVVGATFYVVPVAPIVALTRPSEIAKPLGPLVGWPMQFTFKDPLGQHPSHY
ncbi:MAG TPA: hypothetical protein VKH41_11935 [Myxococcota bacterium]|nr:hypothetical protein [Myxococcota bacterium]